MKKIYYLEKHPVKIGDVIEHNGFRAIVTKELIEFNPELFKVEEHTQPMYFKCVNSRRLFTLGRVYEQKDHSEYPERVSLKGDNGVVYSIKDWTSNFLFRNNNCFELTTKEEWDKQELLDKAKRDYPIGTVFNNGSGIQRVTGNNYQCMPLFKNIVVSTDIFAKGGTIYHPIDGWAPILPYLFTSEDGVKIYRSMKTYAVKEDDQSLGMTDYFLGNNPDYTYFYHKENALAYIEKHKEKTLRDYENMLLRTDVNSINAREECSFYHTLKKKETKLYYSKILQLIADDLNDGRYIHIRGNTSYHLSNARSVNVHCGGDEGCVYFKSKELAEKARAILGDNVKYLFK